VYFSSFFFVDSLESIRKVLVNAVRCFEPTILDVPRTPHSKNLSRRKVKTNIFPRRKGLQRRSNSLPHFERCTSARRNRLTCPKTVHRLVDDVLAVLLLLDVRLHNQNVLTPQQVAVLADPLQALGSSCGEDQVCAPEGELIGDMLHNTSPAQRLTFRSRNKFPEIDINR
jgi:hypothetical protein